MSRPAIVFDNVSKRYRLGALSAGNLRWALPDPLRAARRWLRRGRCATPCPEEDRERRELWALKEVSFEVEAGEAVGIIGANGAGKSTLLKLLAGITAPTRGRIETGGRVSPLIEVGAGFHPDLTGRENIYVQGVLLGMSRRELKRKLEAIVAFAELERFVDTPVKRYSSGMYVRLGFSIALHVEPEILLVDEVLAVGDLSFQRKCLAAMGEFRRRARALVFVSHNLAAVSGLCQRCLWIASGRVRMEGDPGRVTSGYLEECRQGWAAGEAATGAAAGSWGTGEIRIVKVEVSGRNGPTASLRVGDALRVRLMFESRIEAGEVFFWACLVDGQGAKLAGTNSERSALAPRIRPGRGEAICEFPELALTPGRYWVTAGIFDRAGPIPHHRVGMAARFDLEGRGDSGRQGLLGADYDGLLYLPSRWSFHQPGG
jgi:lipopolysaccharide transport system ATP-binding protein